MTRKVLKEAQHQVALLVNENRQLTGIGSQATMPAWTLSTLDADLVEFRSIQVSCLHLYQIFALLAVQLMFGLKD